jgi:hypothetical protein
VAKADIKNKKIRNLHKPPLIYLIPLSLQGKGNVLIVTEKVVALKKTHIKNILLMDVYKSFHCYMILLLN